MDMKEKKIGISLKYKLLFLLTIIPVVSLSIYIVLATRLFEHDKLAYVKDSSVSVARSLAAQMRTEVNSFIESIKPIVENYDHNAKKFSENSVNLFNKQERLDGLVLIQKSVSGQFEQIGAQKKSNEFGGAFLTDNAFLEKTRVEAQKEGLLVSVAPFSEMHLIIATLIGDTKDTNQIVAIGLYRATDLYKAFSQAKIYEHFLLDKSGRTLLGPQYSKIDVKVLSEIMKSTVPEGALDVVGEIEQIASYADTGLEGMRVTAIVDRAEALAAVNALLIQSFLFFIILISSTIIISVIASIKLTSALRELYEATKLIAKGQFDIRIKARSNDEVGGLAEGFNFMAGEVSRLMIEAGDKARMAGELETVKVVQETLFPAEQMNFGKYSVIGHFEPASECGGDWWNYSVIGDKLYLWIGDATGHGAPAAMVTSAAKSASTIIDDMPLMSPAKVLTIMNKAIHETTKGRILMTFFVASIDMKTGEMVYANASHEPPYIIRPDAGENKITKKNLKPLLDASGSRLGDKRSSEYNEGRFQMKEGDAILLYTDGIVDLKNPEGKVWGERGFIKSICDSASAGPSAEIKLKKLKLNISTFRNKTELVDDITLLMCQFGEAA